jgi:uncharacterized membrane protein YjjP (DUF1212 family)
VNESARDETRDLQAFVVQLGAAVNATGETVTSVQERLTRVTRAYGADATVSAFPTYLMVAMGRGEPTIVELTAPLAGPPRLDQIAAVDRLLEEAERGAVRPADGLRALDEIREMAPRFGRVKSIVGYSVLTVGLCLILQPAAREVAAAAVLGALVGLLLTIGKGQSPLRILMPVIAAFSVAALGALAVKGGFSDSGLHAMVASLVVFLPGAALTTAVLELAAGQMVSGSSRLVSGVMQLALLAFGILAGIDAVGVPASQVFTSSVEAMGDWAPWVGVAVFALGVTVAHSAPAKSLGGLLIVLYAAWGGQVLGNALLGGYVSAFIGAIVMTIVAVLVSQLPSAMPAHALFIPGFWLLVPGGSWADRSHPACRRCTCGGDRGPCGDGCVDLCGRHRRPLRHAAHGRGGRNPEGRRRSVCVPRRACHVAEAAHDARSRLVKLRRQWPTSVTADNRYPSDLIGGRR